MMGGKYWSVEGTKSTLNTEFQNLQIETSEAGTGCVPFACVVSYLAFPSQKGFLTEIITKMASEFFVW